MAGILSVADAAQWRAWLATAGRSETEVWLVIPHRDSGVAGVRYGEAIEQALCFGWIDSHARRHDRHSLRLRFTPRRPRSSWSAVNRERAARMTELGQMTERGQAVIDQAKAAGTWDAAAGGGGMPGDLRAALEADPAAHANFERFPPSSRRLIVEWIATAKRPSTRQRRIARTVELAAVNVRANHPGVRMAR
ncbi:YdeI/OmpD-associated family protein [Amycolatopsis suaedae]|uniref:Bacteriocin-protection protein n=1 Tax=Amycolatopsis suaedae TaxID=2510978 RepID=A0A4Q7J6J4_9PSEU|nr:YdeI/OmpD-associated family protein [Amycolatopsis suaedae]RZQ62456.1 hypothetical protein EWH70_19555 [Amycolatopsis suaedae]